MTPLLETIIGIIFIFLIFSLITSWIVEWFSTRLSRRGKMLRMFLYSALEDSFNTSWGPQIYAHPLIDTLHRYVEKPNSRWQRLLYGNRLDVKRRPPAYIPSHQFARAFMDVVRQQAHLPQFIQDASSGKYVVADPTIIGRKLADGVLTERTPQDAFRQFVDIINELQPSDVKTTLAAIARDIDPDSPGALKALEQGIARWYEAGMERLSGWYKRSTRPWLFGIGLIVAIGFNVDTMQVVSRLYADPQMRIAVNSAAIDFLAKNDTLPQYDGNGSLDSLKQKISELRATLDPLNLPIGWGRAIDTIAMKHAAEDSQREKSEGWRSVGRHVGSLYRLYVARPVTLAWQGLPEHAIGWLLTAFAISFGANFWFDILKRLVNMRSQGVKPESEVKQT